MTRLTTIAAAAMLLALGGCMVTTDDVTIQVVNETGLDVTPNLFVSGVAADAGSLFVDGNRRTDYTSDDFGELRAGRTGSFNVFCDEARSIGVNLPTAFDGDLFEQIASADSFVLLLDADYECNTTVRIVYYLDAGALRVRVE